MISLKALRDKEAGLRKEIKEKTITYVLAAFSFVAGLAWNDAIKSFIDQFFPADKSSILIKLLYAIIVTVTIVLVSIYLVKSSEEKKEEEK